MSRTHYQAAPAPLDEMPTLTDDGDEKGRYDFLMFLFLFISTPYLQFKGMYLLNISVNFEPTYSSIYSNLGPQLTVYRFLLLFFRLITLFFIRFFYSSASASAPTTRAPSVPVDSTGGAGPAAGFGSSNRPTHPISGSGDPITGVVVFIIRIFSIRRQRAPT